MKNHAEMFKALLAGETLEGQHNGYEVKLSSKGELMSRLKDRNCDFVYFHNTEALINRHEDYTVKQKTLTINGIEFPEPLQEKPSHNETYWHVSISYEQLKEGMVDYLEWDDDSGDNLLLHLGLIHKTKEAAMLHAKALLSFTRKDM